MSLSNEDWYPAFGAKVRTASGDVISIMNMGSASINRSDLTVIEAPIYFTVVGGRTIYFVPDTDQPHVVAPSNARFVEKPLYREILVKDFGDYEETWALAELRSILPQHHDMYDPSIQFYLVDMTTSEDYLRGFLIDQGRLRHVTDLIAAVTHVKFNKKYRALQASRYMLDGQMSELSEKLWGHRLAFHCALLNAQ